MHENAQQLARDRKEDVDDDNQSDKPPPTLEKIRAEHQPTPIQPEKEILELVGRCLWDIFSDNHEVTGPDGRIVDIGSFRVAGSFLAEMANVQIGHEPGAAEKREMERFERLAEMGSDKPI